MSFAFAFRRAGNPTESLARAAEVLALDPDDVGALMFIAATGPALPTPSDSEIRVVNECALKLLSITLARVKEPNQAGSDAEAPGGSPWLEDQQTQRVSAFVRHLRSNRPADTRTDPEVVKREVGEAALEWVRNVKR